MGSKDSKSLDRFSQNEQSNNAQHHEVESRVPKHKDHVQPILQFQPQNRVVLIYSSPRRLEISDAIES